MAYHIHSFTNARKNEEDGPMIIDRGEGIYVYDSHGKEYIEGLSGLWSVAVGFNNQRLIDAATEQMKKLPFYHNFSSKGHPAVVDLAEKLANITPASVGKTYFCNSGSEANDTAVKMIWYYNNSIGRPKKKKFLARLDGYHGVTLASGSLTGLPWVHADFDMPIIPVIHTTIPHHYHYGLSGESEEDFASRLVDELEEVILEEGAETIAAFIGEPVIGAGGVVPPPATYWGKVQKLCRKYDILLVVDEVICGFGRTGNMFACETYNIKPDIMVLSKQLTSSYVPLSAVVVSDEIYQGIADNSAKLGNFGMGYTTSGHPLATAVALENIKIIEDEGLVENAAAMGEILQAGLKHLETNHPLVGEARGSGLVQAVELVANRERREVFEPRGKVGAYVAEQCHEYGLIARMSRDSICLCPPLIINEDQIGEVLRRLELALNDGYEFCKSENLLTL